MNKIKMSMKLWTQFQTLTRFHTFLSEHEPHWGRLWMLNKKDLTRIIKSNEIRINYIEWRTKSSDKKVAESEWTLIFDTVFTKLLEKS